MTDEELREISGMLDRREERIRQQFELERRERELERKKKVNDWMFLGCQVAAAVMLAFIVMDTLVTCEVRRIVREEVHK
jgi:hypothetical protein